MGQVKKLEMIMQERAAELVGRWVSTIETGATLPLSQLTDMITDALTRVHRDAGNPPDPWQFVINSLMMKRGEIQSLIDVVESLQAKKALVPLDTIA